MKPDHARAVRDALTLGMMERYTTVRASPHMPCEYNLARAYLALREELTAKAREVVERINAAPPTHAEQLRAIDEFQKACPDAFADVDEVSERIGRKF